MKRAVRIMILMGSIFLAGCNLSPLKVAPESHYTITAWPAKIITAQHVTSQNTILVTTPVAASGYASSKMIYVLIPYRLQSYADHRWVAPPAELLLPLLADQLRATKQFKAVVTSPFSGGVTYQLNTQLLTLQQEFLQPKSQVRLTIQVTLVHAVDEQVLASRVFEVLVPTPQNNPYGGVLATNLAAHQVMQDIAKFVVKNINHSR